MMEDSQLPDDCQKGTKKLPFCRLCLTSLGEIKHLFSDNKSEEIVSKIFECTRLKLNFIKNQKDHVCTDCIALLYICANFIETCLKSNIILASITRENDAALKEVKQYEAANVSDTHSVTIPKSESVSDSESDSTENEQDNEWKKLPPLDEDNLLNCTLCDKTFTSKTGLKYHIKTHNEVRKTFECSFCSRIFFSDHYLQNHIGFAHLGDFKYKCKQCGKGYASQGGLVYHERTHKNVRNYVCNICGAAFFIQNSLDTHLERHSDKTFQCDECPKTFSTKNSMRTHRRLHGEKKNDCDVCGRKFHSISHLKRHKVIHTTEKLFKCTICDKRFGNLQQKKMHHTNVHLVIG